MVWCCVVSRALAVGQLLVEGQRNGGPTGAMNGEAALGPGGGRAEMAARWRARSSSGACRACPAAAPGLRRLRRLLAASSLANLGFRRLRDRTQRDFLARTGLLATRILALRANHCPRRHTEGLVGGLTAGLPSLDSSLSRAPQSIRMERPPGRRATRPV